jgi:hypothetical protein
MSTVQSSDPNSQNLFLIIPVAGNKDIKSEEGFVTVKIPEKREGKGKGKTVAFCNILPTEEIDAGNLTVMISSMLQDLQKEIVISLYRAGKTQIVEDEIGIDACVRFWNEKSFSAESVGSWFDSELSPLLAFMIQTAKGWNDPLNGEQEAYVEGKCNAYRASYVECASKFPKLAPDQMAELARVLKLSELSGPIVDKIKEKIIPQVTTSALGF